MPIRATSFLTIVFVSFLSLGCGNSNCRLGGKITFSDDGSPLGRGTVCFDDGVVTARGSINEQGVYTVGSLKENDGLPPGEYRVFIIGAINPAVSGEASVIDARYDSPSTSGLSLKVDGTTRSYDFSVDRATAERKKNSAR